MSAPLHVGPRRSAADVTVTTSVIDAITRSGRSHAGRAPAACGPARGNSACASAMLASASRSAGNTATRTRCTMRIVTRKLVQLSGRLSHHGVRRAAHHRSRWTRPRDERHEHGARRFRRKAIALLDREEHERGSAVIGNAVRRPPMRGPTPGGERRAHDQHRHERELEDEQHERARRRLPPKAPDSEGTMRKTITGTGGCCSSRP